MSNHNKEIPMVVPQIGGQQPFDISEATPTKCQACGCEHFTPAVRLGVISKLASRNRTNQDLLIRFDVYMCRACGLEYGKE